MLSCATRLSEFCKNANPGDGYAGLTATAQAGSQYKNGAGLAAKAKAAVLTVRTTGRGYTLK